MHFTELYNTLLSYLWSARMHNSMCVLMTTKLWRSFQILLAAWSYFLPQLRPFLPRRTQSLISSHKMTIRKLWTTFDTYFMFSFWMFKTTEECKITVQVHLTNNEKTEWTWVSSMGQTDDQWKYCVILHRKLNISPTMPPKRYYQLHGISISASHSSNWPIDAGCVDHICSKFDWFPPNSLQSPFAWRKWLKCVLRSSLSFDAVLFIVAVVPVPVALTLAALRLTIQRHASRPFSLAAFSHTPWNGPDQKHLFFSRLLVLLRPLPPLPAIGPVCVFAQSFWMHFNSFRFSVQFRAISFFIHSVRLHPCSLALVLLCCCCRCTHHAHSL